jgi:hypothetical protein
MRNILPGLNCLLTGKNTGNFDGSGQVPGRKALQDSTLAREQRFQRRIETGNDQGRNREYGFPDTGSSCREFH